MRYNQKNHMRAEEAMSKINRSIEDAWDARDMLKAILEIDELEKFPAWRRWLIHISSVVYFMAVLWLLAFGPVMMFYIIKGETDLVCANLGRFTALATFVFGGLCGQLAMAESFHEPMKYQEKIRKWVFPFLYDEGEDG